MRFSSIVLQWHRRHEKEERMLLGGRGLFSETMNRIGNSRRLSLGLLEQTGRIRECWNDTVRCGFVAPPSWMYISTATTAACFAAVSCLAVDLRPFSGSGRCCFSSCCSKKAVLSWSRMAACHRPDYRSSFSPQSAERPLRPLRCAPASICA
ncbi:hypothetical protein JOL62DRAFT_586958 [Phyllosticta paracitricarpa]|uniref:Uncharacterized protein n=2 Tax=Phyllosticta TaxID=121621 RepID=A0ABR1LS24_9PEZI